METIVETNKANDFNRWLNLSKYIIKKYFYWAYQTRSNARAYKRLLEYNDLVQEAAIAILQAQKKYDPDRVTNGKKATFATYVFASIFNSIFHLVDSNMSQLSVKHWKKVMKSNNVTSQDALKKAMSCVLFSEIFNDDDGEQSYQHPDPRAPAINTIDSQEWINFCMEKLRHELGKRETDILMMRSQGSTLKEVGDKYGVSGEEIRLTARELLFKAASVLADQEEYM